MWLWLILSPPATHSRTVDAAISASAPCVCLICVCSFVITKKWGGGGQTGFSLLFFFLPALCINGQKSEESEDTRRQKAGGNTGDCQAACDKTFSRKLSSCHKALLFWIPKGFEFTKQTLKRLNLRPFKRWRTAARVTPLKAPPARWRCWWWWRRVTSLCISTKVIH